MIAIEVDPVLVHYLRQKFAGEIAEGRLHLIEGDVLKTDLAQWGAAVIAGNLPYYITSPILEKLHSLGSAQRGAELKGWIRAVFLVQAEVAARLAAAPGSRDYGYLSVLTQVYARPEILMAVPRSAFRPQPKVDSAVVKLEPADALRDFGIADREGFLRFASLAFRQKRKTLRNNLSAAYPRELLDRIPETRLRAEQMGIPELVALERAIAASNA